MRISKSELDNILKKNKSITIECKQVERSNVVLKPSEDLSFNVPGLPIACPRMTQRDKWMKRPSVMRYREYSDKLRTFINLNDLYVGRVCMKFFIPMPESWSLKKKAQMCGRPHQVKPDWDNLAKGVQDALLQNDSMIWQAYVEKYWVYSGFERTELKFSVK